MKSVTIQTFEALNQMVEAGAPLRSPRRNARGRPATDTSICRRALSAHHSYHCRS